LAGGTGTFIFRPIQESDRVNKFQVAKENDGLRAFLKKSALKFSASNIAKTYVAIEKDNAEQPLIRSYISILLSEIKKEYAATDDCPEANRYNFPAVKIARLATDQNFEGKGLGGGLIAFVAGLVREHVMPHAGCRFLILDANRAKIEFYKKRGFVLVDNDENLRAENQNPVMFMDLHKIAVQPPANSN
jgi:GNAT superfamily N-acetyltransferase